MTAHPETTPGLNSDAPFDLVIRNGRIVSDGQVIDGDLAVRGECIAAIGPDLGPAMRDIDAAGRWVLPGGIDSHCHIEQLSGMGVMGADDFHSATVSAAFGGTTTVIPFAAQHRGNALPDALRDYAARAAEKAVIDYGFHVILANPDAQTLATDLPAAIRAGITSVKVYMTYDRMKLDDYQLLDVLALAREEQALVMIHAENNDMIKWLAQRLIERGHSAPRFHAVAHDPLAEAEATYRAIAMSRLLDVPILIVHVAGGETVELIRHAQKLGAQVLAESCPQYLFLKADDLDRPGMEGAKFCCSPPPRDEASQEAIWQGLLDGTLATYSSDHAPYRFDETGKLPKGDLTTFKDMANGVPGLELRLPLLFSEGFLQGRMDIHQFVALTAGNHARLYGLAPRKGALAVGADADIAIWNAERQTVIRADELHDRVGYTPYEGRTIQGWPEVVINRGRIVVADGALQVARGSGRYLPRGAPSHAGLMAPRSDAAVRRQGMVLTALRDIG
ncbi:dihydropyrimidinase [soil metagenome]